MLAETFSYTDASKAVLPIDTTDLARAELSKELSATSNPIWGINATNAGLFSAAAYDAIGAPEPTLTGWSEDTRASVLSDDGKEQVRIFYNDGTNEMVLAIRGSDNMTNVKSAATNAGANAYDSFHNDLLTAYNQAENDHGGYHLYTDGHSLGGGMAQNLALELLLDGFGQNSTPLTTGTSQDVSNYQKTHYFIETDVAGDPITLYFHKLGHGTYLDSSPTEIPSIYPAIEKLGINLTAFNVGAEGIIAWAYHYAHKISTFNNLVLNYELGSDGHVHTGSSVTNLPASSAIWFLYGLSLLQSTSENGDGTLAVTDGLQYHYNVSSNVPGDSDVQNVTVVDNTYGFAFSAHLANSDEANPVYTVSNKMEDDGAGFFEIDYQYNADGSFDGTEGWANTSFANLQAFHFNAQSGAMSNDSGYEWFNYANADGSFGRENQYTGHFQMSEDGTATLTFEYAGNYGTEKLTYNTDGSYKYEFWDSDAQYSAYILNADGSETWV